MASKTERLDLNTIPYDAPLSILEPDKNWVSAQTSKGRRGDVLTDVEVPGADLSGKWIIITGSNNGIGREAALKFASWGANLILGCRNPPPHETHPLVVVAECKAHAEAANHLKTEIEYWDIDMANLASVEAFAKKWLDTGRPLDILCNNAGMGSSPKPMPFLTKDGFEIIHQVNFTSHVLLTLSLLPSLAKASYARIICTTSCFHYPGKFDLGNWNGEKGDTGHDGVQYYQNNKLNYQIWLTELQHRLLQHQEYKHITINGLHPGYVNSGIWNMSDKQPIKEFILKAVAYFLAINPQQGSMCILYAATAPSYGPVGVNGGLGGGRYFNRIWEEEPMPHTKDRDCRMRVWRKVNDELKLQEKGLLDIIGLLATK